MSSDPEFTRWRSVLKPVSPTDPLGILSMLKEDHIPALFVVLLWDGEKLTGPRQFPNQELADEFLAGSRDIGKPITHYLIVPRV